MLLNANARSVTPRVIRAVAEVVPARDLYVSHTFDEARSIAAEVAHRGYHTVLTGGGDGTFVGFLNALFDHYDRPALGDGRGPVPALARRPLPRVGVLRLGTGNALAHHTGASPLRRAGVLEDILQARAGRLTTARRLDLLEVEGTHAPFAGLGYDALILNNYVRWRERLQDGPFRGFGEGGWGYGLSIALLSVPQGVATRHPAEVEVVNTGAPAVAVDPQGNPIGDPIPQGGVLYAGPATMVGAGTCPYYGYGFKMFPAADKRPGRFQLRVTRIGALQAVRHLRAIWKGTYQAPHVLDLQVESVSLRFSRPQPFQIGGDAAGWRREVNLAVSDRPVEVVDFARRALAA